MTAAPKRHALFRYREEVAPPRRGTPEYEAWYKGEAEKTMASVDAMPADVRALVHEFGMQDVYPIRHLPASEIRAKCEARRA